MKERSININYIIGQIIIIESKDSKAGFISNFQYFDSTTPTKIAIYAPT